MKASPVRLGGGSLFYLSTEVEARGRHPLGRFLWWNNAARLRIFERQVGMVAGGSGQQGELPYSRLVSSAKGNRVERKVETREAR